MRRLVVLGAGTAGTMVVNKLRRRLARSQWQITVVEAGEKHFYQPVSCSCRSVRTPPSSWSSRSVHCFVESGDGKALLIDFNYDTEPLPGSYPLPGVGPFRLLTEAAVNHWGKLAFRWMYWHLLLPGRPIPLPATMSMAGKHVPTSEK